MTLPHVPAYLFRVQEISLQRLPSPKTTTLCPWKSMVERWKFLLRFGPIFRCFLLLVSRRVSISTQAKERCAFNCRFFRNVLNATGTAQGAGECWWDGGEAADGGGSFGEKNTENSKRNHIFFRFWLCFIGQIHDFGSYIFINHKSTDSKEIHSEEGTFRIMITTTAEPASLQNFWMELMKAFFEGISFGWPAGISNSYAVQLWQKTPHANPGTPGNSLQEAYFKKVEVNFSWIITLLMGLMNHFWQNWTWVTCNIYLLNTN